MDFKDLTYVMAIAEQQNITKAARSLYVSQPALTKFLQKLELDLGQKLFRRVGNKFLLTYAGTRYLAKATEILQLKKELDQEMADIIKSNIGELNIAFPVMRGTYMLPCTLPVFKERYPNVRLNITEAPSSTLEKLLFAGTIDLAFFNAPTKNPDLAYDIIATEDLVMLISPKNPWAHKGVKRKGCPYPWLDIAALKDETFIIQNPEQRTRQIVDKFLKTQDIKLEHTVVTSNIRAAAELAAKNYGIAFICATHLKHMKLAEATTCFSFGSPRLTIDFIAAYRKGSYLSFHAQEYIQIVKQFT